MSTNTANSVTKRRNVEQLAAVNQTPTLKNFFAATIDHLFQPGQSEAISGYIGQKPVYYNPDTDYYIAEPSTARTEYQLEAGMISANSGGTITDTLTYDDLINYLSSQGAFVNNHSRLFEGDYYSWAPPCDLDKLNNYLQYVWLGSLSEANNAATVITLSSPRNSFSYDGNTSKTYPLPATVVGISASVEDHVALVNGQVVSSDTDNTGSIIIDSTGLNIGDIIETIRYGDLTAVINGSSTFNFAPFISWQSTIPDYSTRNLLAPNQYVVGQLVYGYDEYGIGNSYLCTADNTAASQFYLQLSEYWTPAVNGQFATTGSRVRLVDGIGTTVSTARYFIFDGVGSSIQLTNDYSTDAGGSTPQYVVIDRRSAEGSPWALRNLWVHQESLQWTGQIWSSFAATRPIIEFLPNIELYNYGTNRLPDVQATLSNTTAQVQENWDIYPFDSGVWDQDKVLVSQINGQFFGKLHPNDTNYIGSVLVDNGYVLQPGDRLFVNQSDSLEPELNNLIYQVISNPNVPLPSGATVDVVELILAGQISRGDIIRIVTPETTSVFADQIEYWYNGVSWVRAQTASNIPLFMLYDDNENQLSDVNGYPETTFAGSSLFAYVVGTGTVDPVLGFPISYDSYGNPIFFLDPIVNRVTYNGGTIAGYYYHHFLDPTAATNGTFSNNWFPEPVPSTQSLVNGVYTIPLNLQANPNNLEVSTISKSQWFDQFSTIMTSQTGFQGVAYSANNWRDTPKNLSFGDSILQHRSPLLKVMLISADTNYDLPSSLRYADQEYTRFRNRFVQTLINIRSSGVLTDSDPATTWVTTALNKMRLGRTNSFPFAGSQMAGGQYFIPPTPSSMGLNLVAQPGLLTDTTYLNPVSMIRGHDGSLVPAFGDWRDAIIVALEQQIYDNIPAQFTTEARPVFDIDYYNQSYFYVDPNGLSFTRTEVDTMLSPFFQRWVQINKLDYRTNNSYDQNNPFSWNYSSCVDINGLPVPGYWRGIYKTYFDTDRPHIAPWEMLGFIDQPSWWQGQYGPAPYTRGNTKLWTDLTNGYVASGIRQGTDLRYARPNLMNYLPVNDEGLLLDPISCGIIRTAPTLQNAAASWQAGDYGPIESLWRTSPSFRFAQAQVSFLMKPARFVEQGWDTLNQAKDITGEWIYIPTGNRPQNDELYVHGELNSDGTEIIHLGVQQWISDYMVSTGQNPSIFGSAIRGLDVRLLHKMAGFTTANNLSILADNFGLVPAEDISISLYSSPSTNQSVYSGVLIEWTGQGWRVLGYDVRNPFFSVIPGFSTGPKGVISLAASQEPVISPWRPNVYYTVGTNVSYGNVIYSCITSNTSGATFEVDYWTAFGNVPQQAPRVVTYLKANNNVVNTVPYGTVFSTYQEVSDFLIGYGRYLTQQGWKFEGINPETQEPLNWNLMVKDFLSWAQVNWQPGNFISLSPAAQGATFSTTIGMVDNILDPVNGSYSMLDRAGMPIDRSNIVVNRIDGSATMLSVNNDIFACRVSVSEIEHILIFSNFTVFNDLIYDPLFNLRQPRLLVIGRRSTNWTGRLDAPGYMLINNQIQSNFTKAADDLLTMFDIEQADNAVLTAHARNDIGYDNRDYLSTLVLSDVEQFEFYQGLIHQKGAPGAFDKLLRSTYIEESSSTLNFFEEWAIKVNEFGAVNEKNARIAVLFGQSSITQDPQYIEFRQTNAAANVVSFQSNPNWIELVDDSIKGLDQKWVERPPNPLQTFSQRPMLERQLGDFPVAGYVRLNEVDYTVFNASDIPNLYVANVSTLPTGSVTWAHNNDVYRTIGNSADTTDWYLLGTETSPGYWDGSAVETLAQNNVITDILGNSYYQTNPLESVFLTNQDYFTPTPGQTYTISFTVRKITQDTNGVPSYVRPAFDGFRSDGTEDGALGIKNGFGYNSSIDLIDTTNWQIGTWYQVESTWTCPSTPYYATARGRIRINRTYPNDGPGTTFSNTVYQIQNSVVEISQPVDWDALKSYNMSADGNVNTIANVVTNYEDSSISNTITRIFTVNPHGLTSVDTGLFCIIDGSTGGDPNEQGINKIFNVGPNYFDLSLPGIQGYDFTSNGEIGPPVRILRSIHFPNMDSFNASKTRIGIQNGDLAYVDGSANVPWQVLQCNSVTEITDDYAQNQQIINYTFWPVVRSQPRRMDAHRILGSLIYDLQTKITTTDLQPLPLSLNDLITISPQIGIVPGIAMDEIDYAVDYDPALYDVFSENASQGVIVYNSTGNSTGIWGPSQVGRVWWDLSTVRFLETETDNVSFGLTPPDRYNAEVQYRIDNWGDAAPNTSVDVYEWTRSSLNPFDYTNAVSSDSTGTYTGTVYNASEPTWVEAEEYVGNIPTTFYYFWVKNVTVTPDVPFRNIDVYTVAQYITNPMIEDAPWIAPIMPNGILVGGANPFVDDPFNVTNGVATSGTVLQIELKTQSDDGVLHDQWILLRPTDEQSLPPNWLWRKLRDSLVGFDSNKVNLTINLSEPVALPAINKPPIWYSGAPPAPPFNK